MQIAWALNPLSPGISAGEEVHCTEGGELVTTDKIEQGVITVEILVSCLPRRIG